MIFSVLRRDASYFLIISALAMSFFMSSRPSPAMADGDGGTGASENTRKETLSSSETAANPETKTGTESENTSETGVDPLQACCDSMNKLAAKLKFKDLAGHENYEEINRRVKRIENAIKNGGELYSPDGTSARTPREKLDEMLASEKERLEEAKKAISRSQKELDEMMAAALHIESGSPEKPAICPANGAYSVTQDEKLRYIVRCSVHGSLNEIRARLYEKAMKSADPGKFCRGNISAIAGACERYSIDYGVPAEWSLEALIEEGYLDGECVCPAGGVYTVRGGQRKDFTCSCSVHK